MSSHSRLSRVRVDMSVCPFRCLLLMALCCDVLCVPQESHLKDTHTDIFPDNFLESLETLFGQREVSGAHARFSLRKASEPHEDDCYIVPGEEESLGTCSFNSTAKTFLVIHGWTVSGLFDHWVGKLVEALYGREKDANVIVVDWLNTAQNHYSMAARDTQKVGEEVGRFIDWIEETTNIPLEKLHLIGYSLGAHVAGIAGSRATNKVGRITGLDPAGLDFEGVLAHARLSPDDAQFVDVLHTFSGGSLGLSIGIEQPLGHVDIYPNGGSFQPGCNMRGALENIAQYGLPAMNHAVRCEQERSVYLFIDSLLNRSNPSKAYSCSSSDTFERGVCLGCRKNRCNTLGYDVKRVRTKRSVTMFTKTRAFTPYRVHHYQLKIQITAKTKEVKMEPTMTVSLYGTSGTVENIQVNVKGKTMTGKTHSFLLVAEKDVGDLTKIKLTMVDTHSRSVPTWTWWHGHSAHSEFQIQNISTRSGETQKRTVFCLKEHRKEDWVHEMTFLKCKKEWRKTSKRLESQ